MTDAPRFKCWWERIEGTRVLVMKRDEWVAAVGALESPVNLQISTTPIAGVAKDSAVVASVAERLAPAGASVSIYRHDPKDTITPINKDDYDVWTDLPSHPKFKEIIAAASTTDNTNLRSFCAEHVFFVKRAPGDDHWLSELPSPIHALLQKE